MEILEKIADFASQVCHCIKCVAGRICHNIKYGVPETEVAINTSFYNKETAAYNDVSTVHILYKGITIDFNRKCVTLLFSYNQEAFNSLKVFCNFDTVSVLASAKVYGWFIDRAWTLLCGSGKLSVNIGSAGQEDSVTMEVSIENFSGHIASAFGKRMLVG